MAITTEQHEGLCRIRIDGDLTIYEAAEARETLVGLLAACTWFELDLSEVSTLDTAGIQLLLAWGREIQASGRQVEVSGTSDAVADVMESYALSALFAPAAAA